MSVRGAPGLDINRKVSNRYDRLVHRTKIKTVISPMWSSERVSLLLSKTRSGLRYCKGVLSTMFIFL